MVVPSASTASALVPPSSSPAMSTSLAVSEAAGTTRPTVPPQLGRDGEMLDSWLDGDRAGLRQSPRRGGDRHARGSHERERDAQPGHLGHGAEQGAAELGPGATDQHGNGEGVRRQARAAKRFVLAVQRGGGRRREHERDPGAEERAAGDADDGVGGRRYGGRTQSGDAAGRPEGFGGRPADQLSLIHI